MVISAQTPKHRDLQVKREGGRRPARTGDLLLVRQQIGSTDRPYGLPSLSEPSRTFVNVLSHRQGRTRARREVVGMICPDCLTLGEQRAIQAEKARVIGD